jgi:hypothetical protein
LNYLRSKAFSGRNRGKEDAKMAKWLFWVNKEQVTTPLPERLKRFVHMPGIQEPIKVIVPI